MSVGELQEHKVHPSHLPTTRRSTSKYTCFNVFFGFCGLFPYILIEFNSTSIYWKTVMHNEMGCYVELGYKDEEQTFPAIIKVKL